MRVFTSSIEAQSHPVWRWVEMCRQIQGWSHDRSRQTAAVIIRDNDNLVACGSNTFPTGCKHTQEERHERPAKYKWIEHAERNAIYRAAATGVPLNGCAMVTLWYPCADCARAIIQSGIVKLFCVEPDWEDDKWADDFIIVQDMLVEAQVSVVYMRDIDPPEMR